MSKHTTTMSLERTTKGTYVYSESEQADPSLIRTLYVQKASLGKIPPPHIKVTIEAEAAE